MSGPDRTRGAVVETALRLVDREGLGAVTIARLTQDSGVSSGSLYHHFGSREGVLRRLVVECFADLAADLAGALDDRPARECIGDLIARHLAWVARWPGRAEVLYAATLRPEVTGDAVAGREILAEKAVAARPLMAWLETRQAAGEIRRIPPWAVDPIVMAPAHEVSRRGMSGPEVQREVAAAVWAALAPPR